MVKFEDLSDMEMDFLVGGLGESEVDPQGTPLVLVSVASRVVSKQVSKQVSKSVGSAIASFVGSYLVTKTACN